MAAKERLVETGDPLVRVWMLGPFVVELRQADGSWQALPGGIWRTYFYGRPLLQRLLCAHGRRLERQQLLADLWPREEPSEAVERYPLTAAGQVRRLLGRRELLKTCGQGYQLADQRWIWTDVDEALWWLGEARRQGLETLAALPALQGAERLFRRGRLLEEQAAVWAVAYREWVAGERWRAGLALARLYEREGMLSEAGEQYRQMYEEHPYREGALIEVYGWWLRQGERERAERVLRAGRQRLEQEGVPLSEEAQERVRRLRERQESGPLARVQGKTVVYWEGSKGALREEAREERGGSALLQALPAPGMRLLPAGSEEERGEEARRGDCGTSVLLWPLTWGRKGQGSLREMEQLIQEELCMSECTREPAEGRTAMEQRLPRRTALLVLAGLPQVLFGLGSVGASWEWAGDSRRGEGRLREEVLPVVAGSITASWHLLNEGEFETVERTIGGLLPWLRAWAYEPSREEVQREAAYLAAQACLLYALVEHHRLHFQRRLHLTREAVTLSRLSGHSLLLVETLTELGVACYWCGLPGHMVEAYREAESLMQPLPPLSKHIVLRGLARAYAHQGREHEALQLLDMAQRYAVEDPRTGAVPIFLAAQEGYHMHILYSGFVYLELSRYANTREHSQRAEEALRDLQSCSGPVPERIRLEILNRRGEAAIGRGELEEYVSYTVQGAEGARRLGSGKRRQELVSNWRRALERWPGEKRVRELGELVLWT